MLHVSSINDLRLSGRLPHLAKQTAFTDFITVLTRFKRDKFGDYST